MTQPCWMRRIQSYHPHFQGLKSVEHTLKVFLFQMDDSYKHDRLEFWNSFKCDICTPTARDSVQCMMQS